MALPGTALKWYVTELKGEGTIKHILDIIIIPQYPNEYF